MAKNDEKKFVEEDGDEKKSIVTTPVNPQMKNKVQEDVEELYKKLFSKNPAYKDCKPEIIQDGPSKGSIILTFKSTKDQEQFAKELAKKGHDFELKNLRTGKLLFSAKNGKLQDHREKKMEVTAPQVVPDKGYGVQADSHPESQSVEKKPTPAPAAGYGVQADSHVGPQSVEKKPAPAPAAGYGVQADSHVGQQSAGGKPAGGKSAQTPTHHGIPPSMGTQPSTTNKPLAHMPGNKSDVKDSPSSPEPTPDNKNEPE